ncbi:hypothetical protein GCM10023065_08380 [Microbacterium laevaniformans]|nr:hypothetical protein GCM10017578_07440 [Microbacterium laevaniformans]
MRCLRNSVDSLIVLAPSGLQSALRAAIGVDLDVTILAGEEIASPQGLCRAVEGEEARWGPVDEVIVTDDSWFGPAAPLAPVFERMTAQRHSTWTMMGSSAYSTMWIGIERVFFAEWARCGGELGAALERIASEAQTAGAVAFPQPVDEAVAHGGAPLVPIALFIDPPGTLDLPHVVRTIENAGLRAGTVAQHLARHIDPRTLNARLALMSVLPVGGTSEYPTDRTMDVRVVVHVEPGHAVEGIIPALRLLAPLSRLVATVADEDVRRVQRAFESHALTVEIRPVDPREGQMGALLRGCSELLRADSLDDLLVAIRVGTVRGSVPRVKQYRIRHSQTAVFADAVHLNAVLDLFHGDPHLGFVLPPVIAIGGEDLGSGWRGRVERAAALRRSLGVEVPLGDSPLEPPAGIWIARVAALGTLRRYPLTAADHRRDTVEGGVLEALIAHVVGANGFSSRTVIDPRGAAISHADLEYTLDQLAAAIRGTPTQQIQLLTRMGDLGDGSVKATLRAAWRRARANRRANRA